ncbi:hypothetical protein EZV61_18515 [Corallincola luteus]|uniref:Uncharacterized protein n=1 Tax=Corallincola luteus TaxID=1775177 RepID=A0ABY2AIZ2_9GAMM|nr:hypothetical protein [Corallincola luteus]TCI01272.1 hypothetical protein EZV61_18515 [Corallincola luteus]
MIKTWNGVRRIAFIPVWNNQVDFEPPANWTELIQARAFYDPDAASGLDLSLQRYLQIMSSGRAHIEGAVFPVVEASDDDTMGAALNSLPPNHGYDLAVAVLPHSTGPHRGGFAWMGGAAVNGVSDFARVAMFDDRELGRTQNIGVWAMEVLHIVTYFGDLYNVSPQLNRFDVMACGCGTHPSAHTKSHMGWLSSNAIKVHPLGKTKNYTLHAVSLFQPAPSWRATAVRIESKNGPGHFLVECRLAIDEYDGSSAVSQGIVSEGVIVYEVQGETEVYLKTPTALRAGEKFEDESEDLIISVTDSAANGFVIQVKSKGKNRCVQLFEQIKSIKLSLEVENDFFRRKQLISELVKTQKEYRTQQCLILENPATEAVMTAAPSSLNRTEEKPDDVKRPSISECKKED